MCMYDQNVSFLPRLTIFTYVVYINYNNLKEYLCALIGARTHESDYVLYLSCHFILKSYFYERLMTS